MGLIVVSSFWAWNTSKEFDPADGWTCFRSMLGCHCSSCPGSCLALDLPKRCALVISIDHETCVLTMDLIPRGGSESNMSIVWNIFCSIKIALRNCFYIRDILCMINDHAWKESHRRSQGVQEQLGRPTECLATIWPWSQASSRSLCHVFPTLEPKDKPAKHSWPTTKKNMSRHAVPAKWVVPKILDKHGVDQQIINIGLFCKRSIIRSVISLYQPLSNITNHSWPLEPPCIIKQPWPTTDYWTI